MYCWASVVNLMVFMFVSPIIVISASEISILSMFLVMSGPPTNIYALPEHGSPISRST